MTVMPATLSNYDNATLALEGMPSVTPREQSMQVGIAKLLAEIGYRYRSLPDDLASALELFLPNPTQLVSTAAQFELSPSLTYDDETLLDEPLPRLPLHVRPVRLRLVVAGKSAPRLYGGAEIVLQDLEE